MALDGLECDMDCVLGLLASYGAPTWPSGSLG